MEEVRLSKGGRSCSGDLDDHQPLFRHSPKMKSSFATKVHSRESKTKAVVNLPTIKHLTNSIGVWVCTRLCVGRAYAALWVGWYFAGMSLGSKPKCHGDAV